MAASKKATGKTVGTIVHDEAKRLNIPTTELSTVARNDVLKPIQMDYKRRDPDLDPQIIWRGKYGQEGMEDGNLFVRAAPLYIQEKVHPKVLIDDLKRESEARTKKNTPLPQQYNLFADFNGIPADVDKTEFYQHEQNWSNRLILGDSLQVVAGLAERESLRGQVQCIYFDPPYGIKFNSNFQWSTTSRDNDEKPEHITREAEQVKAFRDTWKDGVHSYFNYIRDRIIVFKEILTGSGSIFLQISNENVHMVRCILDEIFGNENCVSTIIYKKASPEKKTIKNSFNYILWYCNDSKNIKVKKLFRKRELSDGTTEDPKKLALWLILPDGTERPLSTEEKREEAEFPLDARVYRVDKVRDSGQIEGRVFKFSFKGESLLPGEQHCWRGDFDEMSRLGRADRLTRTRETLGYKYFLFDNWGVERTNMWEDTAGKIHDMRYVVETNEKIISRCILMATDPGDLVLDPTCGSGTTAYVAEQWGRRWITIDTSRVALALARARLMGARYPYYLLTDSPEGQKKEAEVTQTVPSIRLTYRKIGHGFVYERVPHITLKSIANNTEIDVIWEKWQEKLEPLRQQLNATLKTAWEEWEMPREETASWPDNVKKIHAAWWQARIARQKEIDASISANADTEYLYDKPYLDTSKVRVAGPFTVESLSPHRMLTLNENDEIIDPLEQAAQEDGQNFTSMILEELKTAGVQQANKADKIIFTSLKTWPGRFINGEGVYAESGQERRAAIFIGPEFGSVARQDLVAAAKEAADAGFDVLLACAFNYDAASADLPSLGRIPILKARMNADLHMSTELKNTGKGNLFIIFGEPDIAIEEVSQNQIQVNIKGVDVFDPAKGEVRSDELDKIACWFIDTDYNEESFFVRHAYFLGANDPYKALQTSLKAEIDREAWESLHSAVSRPFDKPQSGRIAVKVINHLGDEVMKVYKVN